MASNSWYVAEAGFKLRLKNSSPLSNSQALYYSEEVKKDMSRISKAAGGEITLAK